MVTKRYFETLRTWLVLGALLTSFSAAQAAVTARVDRNTIELRGREEDLSELGGIETYENEN